jgi:hypothetical protein
MSAQEKIAKLEGLLERVKRNVALGHGAAPLVGTPRAPSVAPAVAAAAPALASVPAPAEPPDIEVAVVEEVEEFLDEEIEDITDMSAEDAELVEEVLPEQAPAAAAAPEPREPPASSRRPKALDLDAGDDLSGTLESAPSPISELEREVPLKTPPPESGRQVAVAVPQHPAPPRDIEAEVTALVPPESSKVEAEEISKVIPRAPSERPQAASAVMAEALAPVAVLGGTLADGAPADVVPEVVARPAVAATPSAFVAAHARFQPQTFLELLDASLAL